MPCVMSTSNTCYTFELLSSCRFIHVPSVLCAAAGAHWCAGDVCICDRRVIWSSTDGLCVCERPHKHLRLTSPHAATGADLRLVLVDFARGAPRALFRWARRVPRRLDRCVRVGTAARSARRAARPRARGAPVTCTVAVSECLLAVASLAGPFSAPRPHSGHS